MAVTMYWMNCKFLVRASKTYDFKVQIAYRPGASQESRVRFHWQSVRALSRSLNPNLTARSDDGSISPLVNLLKIPPSWRAPVCRTPNVQARGASASLTGWAKDESGMAWLSALQDGAWWAVDTGWQLQEYEARRAEKERRDVALATLAARLMEADDTHVNHRQVLSLKAAVEQIRTFLHSRLTDAFIESPHQRVKEIREHAAVPGLNFRGDCHAGNQTKARWHVTQLKGGQLDTCLVVGL